MAIDLLIMNAWKEAKADFSIRVIAPFEFQIESGSPILFEAFVPDFGSRNGAIVMTEKSRNEAAVKGLWASTLFETYQVYRRPEFIEMLNDWGWFGDKAESPTWYSKP